MKWQSLVIAMSSVLFIACSDDDEGGEGDFSKAAFSQSVYPLMVEYCGLACHVKDGTALPVLGDPDIDLSLSSITASINFENPSQSALVTKLIEDNHNCWSGSDVAACAADARVLAEAIGVWDVGAKSTLAAEFDVVNMAAFGQFTWPIFKENCSNCHDGIGAGSNVIAHESLETAYDAALSKLVINLELPDRSRAVKDVLGGHYCWTECEADAKVIEDSIQEWSDNAKSYGNQRSKQAFDRSTRGILRQYCANNCHDGSNDSVLAEVPFAFASQSLDKAYADTIRSGYVVYDTPVNSSLVTTVQGGHECWPNAQACESNAELIANALKEWLEQDDVVGELSGIGDDEDN